MADDINAEILKALNEVNTNLKNLTNAIATLQTNTNRDAINILDQGLRALLQGQTSDTKGLPLFELIRRNGTNILDAGVRPQTVAIMKGFQAVVQAIQARHNNNSNTFGDILKAIGTVIAAFSE
jgi:hypothetical protein